jgi:two-component system response regulator ArlR
MKVLSIDDSKSVHSFLKVCLPAERYQITHVFSGEEALELISKSNFESYDVILLDWEMPGISGPDVLVKIKEKGISSPVIMLTSRNKPEDIMSVLEKGASEYVMKPFTQDLIQEKINSVLGV